MPPPSRSENAADTIRDALIVLSGHLPLFSADKRRVARAEQHLALRAEAFDALDLLCDSAVVPRVARVMTTNVRTGPCS